MSATLDQNLINEFVIAAHHDLPKVQAMLAEAPDLLNEASEWFETPIQAAAHTGQVEIAAFLLDRGAPLDICTAAMMGLNDDVTAILADDPGASQSTGAHGIPLLYFPALAGHLDIVRQLYDAGTPVNAGEGGTTPLHGAAGSGHAAVVQWLLAHDANPYAEDMNGKMPIEVAEANRFDDVVALLRPYTDVS